MKKIIMICLGIAVTLDGCLEKKANIGILKVKETKEDQELAEAITEKT